MSLTLRCRGPRGQCTLSGVDLGMSTSEFLSLLSEKTGVAQGSIEILTGFPPKAIQLPDGGTVAALALANGDTLTIRQGAAASAPVATASAPAVTSASAPEAPGSFQGAAAASLSGLDEDEMLARAIAASLETDVDTAVSSVPPSASSAGASGRAGPASAPATASTTTEQQQSGVAGRSVTNAPTGGPAPSSMPVPGGEGAAVVRRVIDSDNSCLFNAVGYVMDRSRHRATELREVVAQVVAADPVTFNEGFLGKDVMEYCRWIQEKDKWGGAIELFILSQHYGREIAAFDIRTKRCDVYGQDKGYEERALLIYDGLHYDAMAVAAFEGAPEELDVTMFRPAGPEGAAIMQAAEKLVAATNAARQFTDTTNFSLRCGVCQIGIKGEKEAVEHAKATGHSNFAEY